MSQWGLERKFSGERSAIRVLPHVYTAGAFDAAHSDSIIDCLMLIDIQGDAFEARALFAGLRRVYEGNAYVLWTRTRGQG